LLLHHPFAESHILVIWYRDALALQGRDGLVDEEFCGLRFLTILGELRVCAVCFYPPWQAACCNTYCRDPLDSTGSSTQFLTSSSHSIVTTSRHGHQLAPVAAGLGRAIEALNSSPGSFVGLLTRPLCQCRPPTQGNSQNAFGVYPAGDAPFAARASSFSVYAPPGAITADNESAKWPK
jgi:hypothetical protein